MYLPNKTQFQINLSPDVFYSILLSSCDYYTDFNHLILFFLASSFGLQRDAYPLFSVDYKLLTIIDLYTVCAQ